MTHLHGLDRRGSGGSIPFVQVHIGFFANQVRVPASDTLDLSESVHDLLLAIDIGVEEPKDELEVRLLSRDECCITCKQVATMHQKFYISGRLTHDGRRTMWMMSMGWVFC